MDPNIQSTTDSENLETTHYQPLPNPVVIPLPPPVTSTSDVDMTEAVQAGGKVAESYSQSAYEDAMVHNALDTSANSAALDAAARLAAAASIDEEAVAAPAAVAAVDPSQFESRKGNKKRVDCMVTTT